MKILTGSKSWFSKYPDFVPSDTDYLEIIDNPITFKGFKYVHGNRMCIFKWERCKPMEIIRLILKMNNPLHTASVLNPEFSKNLNITLKHIKILQPLIDKLEGTKWSYLRLMYYFYLKNGDMHLTNCQLDELYKEYKKYKKHE